MRNTQPISLQDQQKKSANISLKSESLWQLMDKMFDVGITYGSQNRNHSDQTGKN